MKRTITFLFTLVCALALLNTLSGCSGGVDLPSLQNPEAEALTTCDGGECGSTQDPNIDAEETPPEIYEKTICRIDDPEKLTKPNEASRGDNILTHVSTTLCGSYVSAPVAPGTHEAALPFHQTVYCENREVPMDNPHPSCSFSSDIVSTYVNVPTTDFGICVLKLEDQEISTPYFVYHNNDQELSHYEILRTCLERFSCEMGTFRSAGIGLIEAANISEPANDDITIIVLRAKDNYVIEATDMGNLANAALVLENANIPLAGDVLDHNESLVGSVLDFIEENCVQ